MVFGIFLPIFCWRQQNFGQTKLFSNRKRKFTWWWMFLPFFIWFGPKKKKWQAVGRCRPPRLFDPQKYPAFVGLSHSNRKHLLFREYKLLIWNKNVFYRIFLPCITKIQCFCLVCCKIIPVTIRQWDKSFWQLTCVYI